MRLCLALAFCLASGAGFAGSADDLPPFDEVYQVLRAHLQGASQTNLNRAAVQGLLDQLDSNAVLVRGDAADSAPPPLGKAIIYDDSYAYLQVLKVEAPLAGDIMAAWRQMAATNRSKIKGVVLDLRFAGGSDFMAAAAAADCFLNSDQPLLECGGQTARSTKKDNAITAPLAVLVNTKTSEAAGGLAAALRETSTGLLLGSQTAGRAHLFQDFPLSDGGKVRIAVGDIKLGDGSVFAGGIKPDISVDINPAEERAYWEEPYRSTVKSITNNPAGINTGLPGQAAANGGGFRRFNEAELVREQREGADLEAEFSGHSRFQPDPGLRTIADPALARALDLLKGLAVVQRGHPG